MFHVRKLKSSMPNMTKKEVKAVKYLRLNKDVGILQADRQLRGGIE
jgi:hypothetical protein